MKPWFIREDNVVPFPKKDKGVVRLPNVNAYPDFLTGVQDLQNHLKNGDISSDIHKKLYQDLIHRFMKTESFETPWFIREAEPQAIQALAKQVSQLPANVSDEIIQKIASAIELARTPDKQQPTPQQSKDANNDPYKSVSTPLKQVDDPDMKKNYQTVAKLMLGNGLSGQEISEIIKGINAGTLINVDNLKKLRSNLAEIISLYNFSDKSKYFYKSLLELIPSQGIGPGEVMFSVLSKRITKGDKGDLSLDNKIKIELKGNKYGGRARDKEVFALRGQNYRELTSDYIEKIIIPYYTKIKPVAKKQTNKQWGLGDIIEIHKSSDQRSKSQQEVALRGILDSLFPGSAYNKQTIAALKSGDKKIAELNYVLANLETYYAAKQGTMAMLFMNSNSKPPVTCYVDSFDDILAGIQNKVLNIIPSVCYPITTPGNEDEAYPQFTISPLI